MDKNNTFISKSAGLYNLLGITEWASFKIMAVGTAVMFGGMGYNYAANNAPQLSLLIVIGTVFLGYFSVDWGLNSLIRYYYDNRNIEVQDEQEKKVRSTLFKWILTLIIIRFIASWSMSLLSNTEVVDFATADSNNSFFVTEAAEKDSTRRADLTKLEKHKDALKSNKSKRVKAAKKEGHRLVQAAINAGTQRWVESPKKHMIYAETKISRGELKKSAPFYKWYSRVNQAKQDSAALISKVYQETNEAVRKYDFAFADTTASYLQTSILKLGEAEAKERAEKVKTRYNYLTAAVSIFGVLGWIGAYIRSLLRRAGVDYERQRTFSHVLNQITNSWWEYLLICLENWFKIDINGDGHIGASPTPSGSKKSRFLSWLKPKTTTKTTGATAKTTGATTAAATTAAPIVETTDETTVQEERVVVKPFHKRTTDKTTTTATTVVPPTPVPTGVSPVVEEKKTTTTKEIVVQIKHGVGFVVHNGVKRDRSWVNKQLNAYKVRQRKYQQKGSDTTVVDANIRLFTNYLEGIDKMEAENTPDS